LLTEKFTTGKNLVDMMKRNKLIMKRLFLSLLICFVLSSCGIPEVILTESFSGVDFDISLVKGWSVLPIEGGAEIVCETAKISVSKVDEPLAKPGDKTTISPYIETLTESLQSNGRVTRNDSVEINTFKSVWIEGSSSQGESITVFIPQRHLLYIIKLEPGHYKDIDLETARKIIKSFIPKTLESSVKPNDPITPVLEPDDPVTSPPPVPTDVEQINPNKNMPIGEKFETEKYSIILPEGWTAKSHTETVASIIPPDLNSGTTVTITWQPTDGKTAREIASIVRDYLAPEAQINAVQLWCGSGAQFEYELEGSSQIQTIYTSSDKYFAITYIKGSIDYKKDYNAILASFNVK